MTDTKPKVSFRETQGNLDRLDELVQGSDYFEDARAEGDYDNLEEFIDGYERVYGDGAWDPEKVVEVVEFEYVGTSRPKEQETLVTDGGHDEGLYGKYEVYEDGEPVESCFVLEPRSDEAARRAIYEYAKATDNQKLASELRGWMEAIEQEVSEA